VTEEKQVPLFIGTNPSGIQTRKMHKQTKDAHEQWKMQKQPKNMNNITQNTKTHRYRVVEN
jgi:hypothetical protein